MKILIFLSIIFSINSQISFNLSSLIFESKYYHWEQFAYIDPFLYVKQPDYKYFNQYFTHLASDSICLYFYIINKLDSNLIDEKNLNNTMKGLFDQVIRVKKNVAIENSLIVFISVEDKIMRIERGLVIQKELNDKICDKIIKNRLPMILKGDYLQGIIGTMSDIQYYHENFDDYQDLEDDEKEKEEEKKEEKKEEEKKEEEKKREEEDEPIKNDEDNKKHNNEKTNNQNNNIIISIIIIILIIISTIIILLYKTRKNTKNRNSNLINYSLFKIDTSNEKI